MYVFYYVWLAITVDLRLMWGALIMVIACALAVLFPAYAFDAIAVGGYGAMLTAWRFWRRSEKDLGALGRDDQRSRPGALANQDFSKLVRSFVQFFIGQSLAFKLNSNRIWRAFDLFPNQVMHAKVIWIICSRFIPVY